MQVGVVVIGDPDRGADLAVVDGQTALHPGLAARQPFLGQFPGGPDALPDRREVVGFERCYRGLDANGKLAPFARFALRVNAQ